MKILIYDMGCRWYRDAICAWMDFDDGLFTIGETYETINQLFDLMIEAYNE